MRKRLRVTLAGQLATAGGALLLAAAVAACASAAPGPAAGANGQAAAGSGHSSAASGQAPATASQSRVLAAARRVKCPPQASISSQPARSHGEPIPAGFTAVAVVECVRLPAIVPVGGTPIVELRRVAVAGLGPLLTALHLPSTSRSRSIDIACLTPAVAFPLIVLIGTDGQLVRPKVPTGLCGQPITAVQASLNALHWQTIGSTKGVSIGPHLGVHVPDITPAVP
jgi:hypothetical protein